MEAFSLKGKRCLVTGATSGIGYATVEALLRLGAGVVFVGRDGAKAEKAGRAFARLAAEAGAPQPRMELADFSVMAEVEALALRLASCGIAFDALVNCAGIYTARRVLTPEGLETQFAVNHLAPFLLVTRLLPAMASDCRIVIVSSESHYFFGRIWWRDPSLAGHYLGILAYGQSKFANVLFSYELARRLASGALTAGPGLPGRRPSVYAVDPGLVNTEMGQKHGKNLSGFIWNIRKKSGTSPELPAAGIAVLVSSSEAEGRTGLYWKNAEPLASSARSYDTLAAVRLWTLSEDAIRRALASTVSPPR